MAGLCLSPACQPESFLPHRNRILVIAIVFQVCIGSFLCYCPGMPNIFNFMPIR